MSLSQSLFASNVAFAGFCHILLPFLDLLFVRFFCRRLFAQIFDLRSWLSVSLPLWSVGTPSPPFRESRFFKPRNHLEPCTDSLELCRRVWHRRKSEQRTFGLQSTRPNGTLVLSSYPKYTRGLSHGFCSCSRARVALGRELQLPMSFSWPFFPGLDQDLFPPHGFPRFLGFDSKTVQRSALCRSRRELSNAYLLAKIGVDTAENEPLEV